MKIDRKQNAFQWWAIKGTNEYALDEQRMNVDRT